MSRKPIDPVLCLFGLLGLLSCLCALLRLAPNRLLSGNPVMLWDLQPSAAALGYGLAWLMLPALSWLRPRGWRLAASGALAVVVLIALPAIAGLGAKHLMAGADPLARVQLGAGFWLALLLAVLIALDRARQLALPRTLTAVVALLVLTAWWAAAVAGVLDALAPMREYAMQRDIFHAALRTHLRLVAGALTVAVVIGFPLGLLAQRRGAAGRGILALLNVMQAVPSIALFALLIAPLAWLARQGRWFAEHGIGGTGAAPALIALVLYALLPIVRSVAAGLDQVPAAATDAARGMGMGRWQRLGRVELPLAWPIWLAGLRVVAVQSIGLTAVAALIGAGGLGRLIFQGLGQGANDLVLLGALAIIALALAADGLFQLLQQLTERHA